MLTLYYSKGTSALAPHILLEEVGADYALKEVPIDTGAQAQPAFQQVNPKGRVPALKAPEGVITENPAILGYIAAVHRDAQMLPETPFDRARAEAFNAYLCATVHVAFAHMARGARWTDDTDAQAALKPKVADNLAECAEVIEKHLLKGPWAMGDRYTYCDPYLFLLPRWMAKAGVEIAPYPRLAAHHAAMQARPATLAALAVHQV
ncbi:MAG TPA: glutathione S-transferase family protein [Roseovarius sp.]|uniref:glutathione S-transferase family protein n=1 Tax=Marivita sp. TaxID=2003365 RepID=UPI0025C21177|nr:glutathione S-transferase family protein [Marivita sp.]HKL44742.1 glutathione S-transferase family protein [Roseovarius sp.]